MAEYVSAAGWAAGDREPTLPLRRVPATGKLIGVCTTHMIIELVTHYHRGRTVGHVKGVCPGCVAKCPPRYEAYVGLYNPATKFHAIMGLTINAVRQILDQLGRIDRCRGLVLELERQKGRTNGRVNVQCKHIWSDCSTLPAPFDALSHLQRIWGVEHAQEIGKLAAEDGRVGFAGVSDSDRRNLIERELGDGTPDLSSSAEIIGQRRFQEPTA